MEQRLANTRRMPLNDKKFIETSLLSDLRVDGRHPSDYRKLTVKLAKQDSSVEVHLGQTHLACCCFLDLGAQDETCEICRMAFDGCCPDCKLPGDDCPLIEQIYTHITDFDALPHVYSVNTFSVEHSWKKSRDLLEKIGRQGDLTGYRVSCLLIGAKDDLTPYPRAVQDSVKIKVSVKLKVLDAHSYYDFDFWLIQKKFDVAGAGTCLKRYTDPSFFIVESASSGKVTVEVQMENKIHKVKQKKGTQLRNGETPEVVPSHAKSLSDNFYLKDPQPQTAEALEHMKKRDTGHQSVSLENKTGDSTVLKIGDSAKVVIKQDMKGRKHKYGFNNNKLEKTEKKKVVDDETGDKHELYEVLRMPSKTKYRCLNQKKM
ncbi:hypothetical protein JHK82_016319 [Glycine max]|nr:hypothetical protein JHK82_016319 [Glycine max]